MLLRITFVRFLKRYDFELEKKEFKFAFKSGYVPKYPTMILKKKQA